MQTTYDTVVIGFGNHAAIEIPDKHIAMLGGSKRAPLKVTVNDYTYQSTATGVDGRCMVVFSTRDRQASGAAAGDHITVTLELDDGYRHVEIPAALQEALSANNVSETFHNCNYSTRKAFVRQVTDAKADDTRQRRIHKIITDLRAS